MSSHIGFCLLYLKNDANDHRTSYEQFIIDNNVQYQEIEATNLLMIN